jgi:2-amino-4-hydroxy-6-hydroxymethyldihydropteridine diphosphokinase
MTEVHLALGSNVGDSQRFIRDAIEQLKTVLNNVKHAPLYRSKAVGYTDQADFINTALSGQTDLQPTDLLVKIKNIEQQLGRQERFRWGPREIDIDIIFFGDNALESPELTLPHLAFRERDFVLRPLSDLNPNLVDPVSGQTVSQLLAVLSAGEQSILERVDVTP